MVELVACLVMAGSILLCGIAIAGMGIQGFSRLIVARLRLPMELALGRSFYWKRQSAQCYRKKSWWWSDSFFWFFIFTGIPPESQWSSNFFNQPHTITEFFPGPLHNFSILPHIQPLGVCIIIPPLSVHLSVVLENLIIRKHPTMADSMQKTIRNFSKVILILFICYFSVVTMVARVH